MEAQRDEADDPGTSAGKKDPVLTEYEKKFLQVKVLDKEFTASAIEKGFATGPQVWIAQKAQEKAFERESSIRSLADFMVQLNFMTEDQKNTVLKEQQRLGSVSGPEAGQDFSVRISRDRMEAVVKIHKGIENLSAGDIRRALEDRGVRFGIYPDSILQCHLDIKNTEFTAASQDFSVELIKDRKASYSFNPGRVDTREKKWAPRWRNNISEKKSF
nr:DUF342 domain-containing protein [Desulfobacula sp.]